MRLRPSRLAPIALLLPACLSTRESGALVLECVRASWEAPRATESGSLLPLLRVEQHGTGCESTRIVLRAFRDADEDGEPDAEGAKLTRTARWTDSRDFSEFLEVALEGGGPTRWVLEIQTPKGDARVDLGWVR